MATAAKKTEQSALSIPELEAQIEELQALLAEKKKAERASLAAEWQRMADERGVAVADVFQHFPGLSLIHTPAPHAEKQKGKNGKTQGTVPPKYRNPADEAQTWSGRGRQPVWLQAHLAGGGKLEDVSIPAAAE